MGGTSRGSKCVHLYILGDLSGWDMCVLLEAEYDISFDKFPCESC